jgi:hypothetical protein
MKTKNDFLNNYSSNPELAKKALKAGGLTWNEIKEMKYDAYAANTGSVPGMIYYSDTVKFAKKNHLLILKSLDDFEHETGAKLENKPSPTDETQYFNWLAWFAWENTMSEVLNYLEY